MYSEKIQPMENEDTSEHEDERLLQIIPSFGLKSEILSQRCTTDDSGMCEVELKVSLNKQELLRDEFETKLLVEIIPDFDLRSEMVSQSCLIDSESCEIELKILLDKQKKLLAPKCFGLFNPCPRNLHSPVGCLHEINCSTRQLI